MTDNSSASIDPIVPPASQPEQGRAGSSWWSKLGHGLSITGTLVSKTISTLFYVMLIGLFLAPSGLFGKGQDNSEVLFGSGENRVAVIDMSGVIQETASSSLGSSEGSISSRGLVETFERLRKVEHLKAIVLRVDSPGGTVTGSEEVYQTIKRYRQQLNVPIVVSMGDVAASGGYYVSLAADKIMANSTTLTGSIGVIFQTINVEELATKYGVKSVTIKSGENKDLLNPLSPVNEGQLNLMQGLVNEAYDQFLQRVADGRSLKREQFIGLADGRILSGLQAEQAGLIDKVGSFYDAVDLAKQLAQIDEAEVVVYGQKSFLDSLLGMVAERIPLKVDVGIHAPELAVNNKLEYLMSL